MRVRSTTFESFVSWALVTIGVAACATAFIGIFNVGVGWDSGIDTLAAQQISQVSDDASLKSVYEQVYSTSEFYGVIIQRLAAILQELLVGNDEGYATGLLSTYRWQAGITVFISSIAAVVFGLATSMATKSKLAGAFSFAALMTWPLYFGMSFVNFKDMPVASGLTLFSAGLVICWASEERRSWQWVGLLSAAFGSIVTLNTRIGAWPLLVALASLSCLVYGFTATITRSWRRVFLVVFACVVGTVAGISSLFVINPFARISLLHWLVDAYLVSKSFPWIGEVRFAGENIISTELPISYVPGYFLAQAPLISIVWGSISIILIATSIFAKRWPSVRGALVNLNPFLIQAFALSSMIILGGSVLYDGVRHLIFVIPGFVCVLAIGIYALELKFKGSQRQSSKILLFGIPLIVVAAACAADLRWFPYSYAFVNPVAQGDSESRRWEFDFWSLSSLEGVNRLREAGLKDVMVLPQLQPQGMAEVGRLLDHPDDLPPGTEYGVYLLQRGDQVLPSENCVVLFDIRRSGQTLGEGARCRVPG